MAGALLAVLALGLRAVQASSAVQPWPTQLAQLVNNYPPAKQLLTTFLNRLGNPYVLQHACWKDSFGRGRGLGRSRCDPASAHPEPGGALCYASCKPGYTSDGVTMCWKSFTDRYSRGAGVPRSCQPDEEEQLSLCYKACPDGFVGVGPACWKTCSAAKYPYYAVDYGAMCCETAEACNTQMYDMAFKFPALWAQVVASGISGNYVAAILEAKTAVDGAMAFALPLCGDPIFTPPPANASASQLAATGQRMRALLESFDDPNTLRAGEPAGTAAEQSRVPSPPSEPKAVSADGAASAASSVSASSTAVALVSDAAPDTCVETVFPASSLTCAQALSTGLSCSKLVTTGYDCHCSCIDKMAQCWKHWLPRGAGSAANMCNASSFYPEKNGSLCYQPCMANYKSDGASQCLKLSLWPPGGSTVYSRGSGADLGCAAGLEYDAGLCYPPCPAGYYGVGPICWQSCDQRGNMPINGGAICCSSAQACGERIINLISGIPFAFADVAVQMATGGAMTPQLAMSTAKNLAEAVAGFQLPACSLPEDAAPPPGSGPNAPSPSQPSPPVPPPAPFGSSLAVQHILQLLPAAAGSALQRLNVSTDDLKAALVSELSQLLGVGASRFSVDLVQKAIPSFLAPLAGSGAPLGPLTNNVVVAFSMLPAPPPAATAWQLSSSLLSQARAALLAGSSVGAAHRRLSASAPLFDASTYPVLSRAVSVESALDVNSDELRKVVGQYFGSNETLPNYSPVTLPLDGSVISWAKMSAELEALANDTSSPSPSPAASPSSSPSAPAAVGNSSAAPRQESQSATAAKTTNLVGMVAALVIVLGLLGFVLGAWLTRKSDWWHFLTRRRGGVGEHKKKAQGVVAVAEIAPVASESVASTKSVADASERIRTGAGKEAKEERA